MPEKADLDALRLDPSSRPQPSRGRGRWLGLGLVLLLAAAGAAFLVWRAAAVPEVETALARQVEGGPGGAGSVLEASGYVVARRAATVSSKVTGKVVEVWVEEGMKVEEGQVLARLDDAIARRQLALAESQLAAAASQLGEIEVRLAEARRNLARTGPLAEAGIATQAQLDADRAAVDSLAARLAAARDDVSVSRDLVELRRQELDDTVIRAPFTGVAISKNAQPGEMISPISAGGGFTRTGISTVVDMSSLEIEVDVNEAFINRVVDGQRVVALLDAYPDWRIPARVITTVPTADRQKATVKVRIAFDRLDPRILPEMGVKVSFLETEEEPGAAAPAPRVLVPRAAVRRQGEQDVVFVVADGRAERRAVRLGRPEGESYQVLAGLAPGDRVVVGGKGLEDGARVKVRQKGGEGSNG